jgi:hypothetical protein
VEHGNERENVQVRHNERRIQFDDRAEIAKVPWRRDRPGLNEHRDRPNQQTLVRKVWRGRLSVRFF